jgi:hypothetical protein
VRDVMKRYLIAIKEETMPQKNGKKYFFPRIHSPDEELIFQALLSEEDIDIKKVMQTIVAGREVEKVREG